MKKILTAVCILSFMLSAASYAATSTTNTTYTERFVKKHTQKIVDKEKELTNKANAAKEKQKAQEAKAKKKQQEQKAKLQKKKDAINTLKSW